MDKAMFDSLRKNKSLLANIPLDMMANIPQSQPLPSVQGGNAMPNSASPQLVSPFQYSSNSSSYHDTKDMNRLERESAMARQEVANATAKDYNENQLPTLMSRANSMYKGATPSLDDNGMPIQMNPVPVLPQAIIPEKIDIPNPITGHFSVAAKESSGTRPAGNQVKRKAPTISTVDWKSGKISPMSPTEVSLDTDGVVQAAMESRNPAFATMAMSDNFGDTPLPKGTMVKIPNIQFDKKTNKYIDMGEVTVDMGGNNYADNMNRIFTAHMAKNMLNDINKNPKMLKNYGTQGGSQLKFNPSVFVAGQGGVYNTTISKSLREALATSGIPSGTTKPVAGSMTAKIVNDPNSKANETWLNAKDNNMLADTINGWGNSTANALMGYLLGVR